MAKERAFMLEAIRVMDEIERRGSFSAAAEALGRVPSALSYTVQKLEDELQVQIFDRSGHRTKLTSVGQLFLTEGRKLLQSMDKLVNDVVALETGWEAEFIINCDVMTLMTPLFSLSLKLARLAKTRLIFLTEVLSDPMSKLINRQCDLAIVPQQYYQKTKGLSSCQLYTESVVRVSSAEHPLPKITSALSLVELITYQQVAIVGRSQTHSTQSMHFLDQLNPLASLAVSTMEDKRNALLLGFGTGLMPKHVVKKDIEQGRLKVIANEPEQSVEMIMVWREGESGMAKQWLLNEIPKSYKIK